MKFRPPLAPRIETKIPDATSDFFAQMTAFQRSILFPPGAIEYLESKAEERRLAAKEKADAEKEVVA